MGTITTEILIVATIACLAILAFQKKIRQSRQWRATVTPLASIIGSGFLVVAPLLYSHFGKYSPYAMLALVTFGYLIGSILRRNILADDSQRTTGLLERLSHVGLLIAYLVPVSFYIKLLA